MRGVGTGYLFLLLFIECFIIVGLACRKSGSSIGAIVYTTISCSSFTTFWLRVSSIALFKSLGKLEVERFFSLDSLYDLVSVSSFSHLFVYLIYQLDICNPLKIINYL